MGECQKHKARSTVTLVEQDYALNIKLRKLILLLNNLKQKYWCHANMI